MKFSIAISAILISSIFAGEQIPMFLSQSERERYVQITRSGIEPTIVNRSEFISFLKEDKIIFLDTRNFEDHKKLRVRNSINLPFLQLNQRSLASIIPRHDAIILFYTSDNFRHRASDPLLTGRAIPSLIDQVTTVLSVYGYTDVRVVDPKIHFQSIPQLLIGVD